MHKNPESLTLASPFSKSYWRTAAQELRNLRMLTLAAIVVALRIVLSGLYIPLGDNLNIFFGYFVNRKVSIQLTSQHKKLRVLKVGMFQGQNS